MLASHSLDVNGHSNSETSWYGVVVEQRLQIGSGEGLKGHLPIAALTTYLKPLQPPLHQAEENQSGRDQ